MIDHNYSLSHIAKIVDAKVFEAPFDQNINALATDSRILGDVTQTLFFAIVAQRDGHHFLADAYEKGVRAFVVSDKQYVGNFKDANYLLVFDVLEALQKLAVYHRSQFDYPVIGVTGSNGKTIVKEWLYQLLGDDFYVVKNQKSFNSQLGVPLAVWQMREENNLGIFEAGISTVGEMQKLEAIIKPTIGVFTNLGDAHAEGFESQHQKLIEKWQLFEHVQQLVYGLDHLPKQLPSNKAKHFTWSLKQAADLQITSLVRQGEETILKAVFNNEEVEAVLSFTDLASIENAVTCWATLLAIGYSNNLIVPRLKKLSHLNMRLKLINGIENCSVIDDSYSADIASLSIALDFLNQQNQHPRKTLILSDFAQSGLDDEKLYKRIAQLVAQKKVSRLIGIGEKLSAFAHLFKIPATFYIGTDEFITRFSPSDFSKETILVKGARRYEFEKIIKLLTQKIHDTILEVNLNALAENVQFYRSKLQPNVKMMAMVKAFSYGSGSFEVANLLQFGKVDYLAVAYADEGIALRKSGITMPIMVMSPEPSAFDAMIRHSLEPELYNFHVLQAFLSFLPADAKYPVHLKLDTGMHRLGFEQQDVTELTKIFNNEKRLSVVSIFSHLVASDDAQHDGFTQHQLDLFNDMYAALTAEMTQKPMRHISNTSGITRWPNAQLDMVRLGIGMYGYDGAFVHAATPLKTVATLKTTITQIKYLPAGETVGYSRRGLLPNGGTIATVKIGYADGYMRAFGNGVGKMFLQGRQVPTVGSICMDMTMLNITGLEAKVGDEVEVFGNELPIEELANWIGTIPYEILTSVSQRVKREYLYE